MNELQKEAIKLIKSNKDFLLIVKKNDEEFTYLWPTDNAGGYSEPLAEFQGYAHNTMICTESGVK